MATYNFSSLQAGSTINFFPATDILNFDASFSAASGSVAQVGSNISLTYGSKTIQLANVTLGQLSTASIKFADGSLLLIGDNSSGSANDDLGNLLSGSALNDLLIGLGGDDTLDGKAGADAMIGGTGNDTYVVDNANDQVSEANGTVEGIDTVQFNPANPATLGSYVLPVNLENLQLLGAANTNGTGNAANNSLTGNGGNNSLNGMTGLDTMTGGDGNDTYVVDNIGDQVVETNTATSQIDTIQTSVNTSVTGYAVQTYLLSANVENLELAGTGTTKLNGLGNDLNNKLTGNSLDNILDGGKGSDSLAGGDGNDIYVVDTTSDKVSETNNSATQLDTVQASVSYTLPNNVENLELLGTANLNGTGNSLNNIFYANPGNNILNGGTGNDTVSYQNSPFANTLTEIGAFMGVSVDLGIATLQDTGGSGLDTLAGIENLIGTAYGDTLTGNSQANSLNGGGGMDLLIGGNGDDTYVVDGGDTVVETSSQGGTDTVQSSADFVLPDNVENLLLTGTAAINGMGNSLGNILTGNSGANQLNGGTGADILIGSGGDDLLNGGQGADNMQGGAGNDTYIVDHAGDVVDESAGAGGGGTDLVRSNINYTLPDGVENLQLLGTLGLSGTGNSLGNTLYANAGNNSLDGGIGTDTVSYQFGTGAGVAINLTTGQATGGSGTDTLLNFENAIGSSYDDTITGTTASNALNGGNGIDTVSYQSGVTAGVTVNLATGQTTGGSGVDSVLNFENAIGGIFNDTILGTTSGNILDGGAGLDTVSYQSGASAGVAINLGLTTAQATGGSGADTLLNFENAIGSGFNDLITGTTGDNILDGGLGTDTVSYQSGAGAGVVINLSLTTQQTTGGSGTDTLLNFENAIGSGFNDLITGTTGNNTLDGGAGTDTVSYQFVTGAVAGVVVNLGLTTAQATGGSGTDTLLNFENVAGSIFNDTLIGSGVNNILTGNLGTDSMTGGLGADKFAFNTLQDSTNAAPDTITDFSHTQGDQIDVGSLYSGTFAFKGTAAFTGAAGQLHYAVSGGNAVVSGDTNGDKVADFTINLTGVTGLVATDFVL